MDLLMGIDLGTTHIKVATFSLDGDLHTLETSRTAAVDLGNGQAIYQPEEIWESVVTLLRKTTARLHPTDTIVSISIASMGEAGLFLGKDGQPLTPIIAWFDARGKEVMDDWYARISPSECFKIAGLNYNYIYSLFKMLWTKENEPEVLERAAKWLCIPDFVNYRLTGELATDYSIATRTMLFDIRERSWSTTLLDLAGLDASLMPPVYPSGSCIGEVTRQVSELTGLQAGTPVSVGGHDHICGALATSVVEPGRVLDSLGTSESLVAVFQKLPELKMESFSGFNVGCHVVPDLYYIQGAIHGAGKSLEWFLQEFFQSSVQAENSFQHLVEEARSAKAGSQGLFYIPHLRGGGPPVRSPHSKACFLGIRDYHTRADFARSIHEGLCCEVNVVLESMEEVLDLTFKKIHAIGGGTKNEFWMEIKSSVTGKSVEIPAVQEATLLGAALLGGVGAKVYKDHQQAIQATYRVGRSYNPEAALKDKYSEVYKVYSEILPLAREISHKINVMW